MEIATSTIEFQNPVKVEDGVIVPIGPGDTHVPFAFQTAIVSSSRPTLYGFTYGEIVQTFFLFSLIVIIVFGFGIPHLRKRFWK